MGSVFCNECRASGHPALNYSPPLQIKSAGNYTGNYRSTSASTAAIEISAPDGATVTIENCTIVGPGTLIHAGTGITLIVKNCNGYGEGASPGPFVDTSSVKSIDVENN